VIDPPSGLIAVPVPKAILLLTEAEYLAGIRRGKWWRRRQAETRRATSGPSPVVASSNSAP
jgi:hypothetical protein